MIKRAQEKVKPKRSIQKRAIRGNGFIDIEPELLMRFVVSGDILTVYRLTNEDMVFLCNDAGEAVLCSGEVLDAIFEKSYSRGTV